MFVVFTAFIQWEYQVIEVHILLRRVNVTWDAVMLYSNKFTIYHICFIRSSSSVE